MICNSFAVSAWSSSASIQTSICSFCIRILILSNKKLVFFYLYSRRENSFYMLLYVKSATLTNSAVVFFSHIELSSFQYKIWFIFPLDIFVFSLCLFFGVYSNHVTFMDFHVGKYKRFSATFIFWGITEKNKCPAVTIFSYLQYNAFCTYIFFYPVYLISLFPYKLIILYTKIQNKWLDWLFFPVISDKMYNFFVCSFCIFVKWPYDEKVSVFQWIWNADTFFLYF